MISFILHKRKSSKPTGTVTEADGMPVGRVFKHSRVAAGMKGARAPFYTAEVCWPGEPNIRPCSLGTRYVTREQAFAAVRDFYRSYPISYLFDEVFEMEWHADLAAEQVAERRRMRYSALGRAIRAWQETRRDGPDAPHRMNVTPPAYRAARQVPEVLR